ncbi:MAG: tRNA (N6-threonylcarbamoyladenosine(37)-N6)-methyltransferase TrmO [Candidatus Odinarchaeia archaeon]
MDIISFKPIGILRSSFNDNNRPPIQSRYGDGAYAVIEVFPEFVDGLKDLDGFSHIFLLYFFHRSGKYSLTVKPYLDREEHGVFATRAPSRPNPIGLSLVELVEVVENKLYVKDVDVYDGSPILDIKPYIPYFDIRSTTKIGWLTNKINSAKKVLDDGRFINP